MTDRQRGDYWLAQYRVVSAQLEIAKARIDSLEKIILSAPSSAGTAAGQSILQSCPSAKLNSAGDIECPKSTPKEPEK